jgi:hypothetical protein
MNENIDIGEKVAARYALDLERSLPLGASR